MVIGGIIAEYNPFHNGHKYQLDLLRQKCDAIVVVMSGSFVQRGDVAITDKFTRAEAAVQNGADLVVELPTVYSLSSAQQFAFGGVNLLKMCGTDLICFGAEDDTESLFNAVKLLEADDRSDEIIKYHSMGNSYPKALSLAYPEISDILAKPNNTLGIEYIRQIRNIGCNFKVYSIKRTGVDHDSSVTTENIASASNIRSIIKNNEPYSQYISDYKISDIRDISALDNAVISTIRILKEDFFLYDKSEVIPRIIRAASLCSDLSTVCEEAKSKNITAAKIRRLILSSFLKLDPSLSKTAPTYIRPLAMNKIGASVLKNIKDIDIITKVADYTKENEMFLADLRATDIAALCGQNKRGCKDFTTSPVFIE